MSDLKKTLTKAIVFMMVIALCAPVVCMQSESVSAATKTPAKPLITYCKAKDTSVTLKWAKAKNAKAYRVYVQTGASKWKYWKKVKKTSKNKRKYSDTLKYKLVESGKKYKIYVQQNPYKIAAKKLTKRTYKYKGINDKIYHFAVRAFNGEKFSKPSAIKTIKIPKKSTEPTQPSEPEEPVWNEGILSAAIDSDNKLVLNVEMKEFEEGALKVGLSPSYVDVPTHFINIGKMESIEGSDRQWTIITDDSLQMDNLYEKIYLIRNDEPVGSPFYIQNPEEFAEITTAFPQAASKKGLKISAAQGDMETAKALEVGHVLLDINLAQFIQKGGYDYKGYSFNDTAIQTRKDLIRSYHEAGIQVTVVVVLGKNGDDLIYPGALSGAIIDSAHFVAFCTKEGREKVQALLEVLASEWCSDGAFVSNWVCGNEVNNIIWNYAGDLSWDEYISVTSDMYRLFNTAVRGTVRNARTYLCFDRRWNMSDSNESDSLRGARRVLEDISANLEKEGTIHFDVALHPYADNLFYPEWWNDNVTNEPSLTTATSMKNIREIAAYLNERYDSRTILSEQGFAGEYSDGTSCQEVQAAAIVAAYYMAAFDDNIDLFGYHRLRDHPNEIKNKGPLPIGLYKVKDSALESYYAAEDGKPKADAASKIFKDASNYEERIAAEVFRYMDSQEYGKADYLVTYYDSSLNSWDDFPGFDKEKLRH